MDTTVLLVDDHPVFRKGLHLLLDDEPDMQVVGEAGDGQAAIELARELAPDVVIMDITMPKLSGVEATRRIVSESPDTKVIALSIHSGSRFIENMLGAGAGGYVLKQSIPEELVKAIRDVIQGEVYLSASVSDTIVTEYTKALAQAPASEGETELTAREKALLQLVAEGNTTEQMASVFEVSPEKFETEQRRMMEKLGLADVAELVEYARVPSGLGDETASRISPTKLHRPQMTPDLVPRPHLVERLEKGLQRKLTLISASPGFGKTTLLTSWLEGCEAPSVWLQLDEKDSDLMVFLRHFLAAIQTLSPGAGRNTQAMLRKPSLSPLPVITESLLQDLDRIEEHFILVLDDYHTIQDEAVHELMSDLIQRLPGRMHLAVATRSDPPFPLTSLRAGGQMVELRTGDLRFSPEDAHLFLEGMVGRELSRETTDLLRDKTEGWIVGLRLIALSMRSLADAEGFARRFEATSSTYVVDYLLGEVMDRQSPEMHSFLVESSIPDRFCASLCDAICFGEAGTDGDSEGAARILEKVKSANLFLVPSDAEGRWYRYHHLFRDLLRHRLHSQEGPEKIAALHSRASRWFAENGQIDEALQHALAAGDSSHAARLVVQSRGIVLVQDKWRVLQKWLDLLPQDVKQQSPELLMAQAWVLFYQLNLQAFASTLEDVEKALGSGQPDAQLKGEMDFFRGYLHYFEGQGALSEECLRSATETIPETQHIIRGEAELHYALALHMTGRKEKALKRLTELIRTKRLPEGIGRTRLWAGLAFIHLLEGELPEALTAARRVLAGGSEGGMTYAESWGAYLEALIHFRWNDLQEAERRFGQLVVNRFTMHTGAAIDSLIGLALTYQATQQPDRAQETMKLLLEFAEQTSDPACLSIAESCQSRLSLVQGDRASAVRWVRSAYLTTDAGIMLWWLEVPRLTECRVLIAEASDASLEEAIGKLKGYEQENKAVHNTYQTIDILTLLALAHMKQGRADEALATLESAIALAEPGGFMRPFVDLGPEMAQMLNELAARGVARQYIGQVLAGFGEPPASPPVGKAEGLIEPLTAREMEVLALLAQRLTNPEIARELVISAGTVKVHTHTIYGKLGVRDRRQAVTRARELGLLAPE